MKAWIFAFTRKGYTLGERLCEELKKNKMDAELLGYGRFAVESGRPSLPLKEQVRKGFAKGNLLIFISALGIAVRLMAPLIQDKFEDPAVLCIDEGGKFVIPVLSGHAGGANHFALRISTAIDARCVITTATDGRGIWAVDSFAIANGLIFANADKILAKEISAALLEGESIGWESDIPFTSCSNTPLPAGLLSGKRCDLNVSVSYRLTAFEEKYKGKKVLCLIPPVLCLGVGCKKGVSREAMLAALRIFSERAGIDLRAVKIVASIDIKKEEAAILSLIQFLGAEGMFFSPEELTAAGEGFSSSEFVRSVTGVDNVCERAAFLVYPELFQKKTCLGGITFALSFDRAYRLRF